jgi:hypothetical protein
LTNLHWREKLAGLLPLALIAQEPRHAHRRAQFAGLCSFKVERRGIIKVKGKGAMETYFLRARRA